MGTKINNFQGHGSTYYRNYEASPIFPFRNAEMTTGTYAMFDFGEETPAVQKFLPLNAMQITNNSDYELYIYPNQSSYAKSIPAGTIITFDAKSLPALRTLKIYNAGSGTINANEIEISVWRDGVVIDNAFARLHKAFFKALYPR